MPVPALADAAPPPLPPPPSPLQRAQELAQRIAPVAAPVYDALVLRSPGARGLAAELTPLALPGTTPPRTLGPGDVVVRRALGEGGVASAYALHERVDPSRLPFDTLVLEV